MSMPGYTENLIVLSINMSGNTEKYTLLVDAINTRDQYAMNTPIN